MWHKTLALMVFLWRCVERQINLHSWLYLLLPAVRPVRGGATDLMISGTVVPFTSTGGRYVTHLSVTPRQRLRFVFRPCSKQVTHLLPLLSGDQHWTFLMLMSGIMDTPSALVCLCVDACACNTQGVTGCCKTVWDCGSQLVESHTVFLIMKLRPKFIPQI